MVATPSITTSGYIATRWNQHSLHGVKLAISEKYKLPSVAVMATSQLAGSTTRLRSRRSRAFKAVCGPNRTTKSSAVATNEAMAMAARNVEVVATVTAGHQRLGTPHQHRVPVVNQGRARLSVNLGTRPFLVCSSHEAHILLTVALDDGFCQQVARNASEQSAVRDGGRLAPFRNTPTTQQGVTPMNKFIASSLAGLTLFGGSVAIAAGFAGTAGAEDNSAQSTPDQGQGREGNREQRRDVAKAALKTAAETIGIDAKDLATELRAGKSVAQVATENGVDPQTVIDAMVAKANTRIDEAVANGKLTAERATTLKTKVAKRITTMVNKVRDGSRPAK